jgi:hypothetical protein
MKRPHFEDVSEIGKCFLGVRRLMLTTRVQIPAKILGYLTGHRRGTPKVHT